MWPPRQSPGWVVGPSSPAPSVRRWSGTTSCSMAQLPASASARCFSCFQPTHRDHVGVRDLWRRVPGAPRRRRDLRSLRRPGGAKKHPHHQHADHGGGYVLYRPLADLQPVAHRADYAGDLAPGAGFRPRRPVGRRDPDVGGVWRCEAARPLDWLHPGRRRVRQLPGDARAGGPGRHAEARGLSGRLGASSRCRWC